MLMKERLRLVHHRRIKIISQIVFDVTRHADEDAPLEEEKYAADHAGAQYLDRSDCQFLPADLLPVRIDGLAYD